MEHRVVSLETQIALMQKDISVLKDRKTEVPPWLKKSSFGVLGVLLVQLASSIWWASEITANHKNMRQDIDANTEFRMEFPKMHEAVMLELKEIKVNNQHTQRMLNEIKDKLRYAKVQQQK